MFKNLFPKKVYSHLCTFLYTDAQGNNVHIQKVLFTRGKIIKVSEWNTFTQSFSEFKANPKSWVVLNTLTIVS